MLHAAAAQGSLGLLEYVLSLGLDVLSVDHEKRNAAHMVCTSSAVDAGAKLALLTRRAAIGMSLQRAKDALGRRPLHFASGCGALYAMLHLLSNTNTAKYMDRADANMWSPLHYACRQKDVMIVEMLVAAGAITAPLALSMDEKTAGEYWVLWDVAVFHGNGTDNFARVLKMEAEDRKTVAQPGFQHDVVCDSCCVPIYGRRHHCETCGFYNLCNLCFRLSSGLHGQGHVFNGIDG